MLTGLDKLRTSVDIVWLFTTNLVEDLDPAFVDRCRLKEEINAPVADTVYEIFRADLNSKMRNTEILIDGMIYDQRREDDNVNATEVLLEDHTTTDNSHIGSIPALEWARFHSPPTATTAVSILRKIARLAVGLSSRNLRGLVDVALFKHVTEDQPRLREVLSALEVVVRKEITEHTVVGRGQAVGTYPEPFIGGKVDKELEFIAASDFDITSHIPVDREESDSDD